MTSNYLSGVAIILPEIDREFKPPHYQFITMALYVGLILGATTWVSTDLLMPSP
jgi:hypothetical protein